MRKKFLSEMIGTDFKEWGQRKIIIQAPTGMGKTSFIVKTILPYCERRKKKLLILCNRRLLRQQYWYELVREFDTYGRMDATVELCSYQELAEQLKQGKEPENLLYGFDVICLDEFHFFYADSDFNGFGTYVLLQALMISGIAKLMIFLSATAECVVPFIKEDLVRANRYLKIKYPVPSCAFGEKYDTLRDDRIVFNEKKEYLEIMNYDYSYLADYDYIRCIQVPDWQTVCGIVADAKGKSIIFVDDKSLAAEMADMIREKGISGKEEVVVLNADNLDDYENDETVKMLVMANKLLPKILVTTSVLDNGVSIHDEVENLVILTESKVSFLQMLGRVRIDSIPGENKLYFVKRPPEYYERREMQGMEMRQAIKELESALSEGREMRLVQQVWDTDDEKTLETVRKLVVFLQEHCDFFDDKYNSSFACRENHFYLQMNEFAEKKILDTYRMEAECHVLSRRSDMAVTLLQMGWLGKEEEELELISSTYMEERREQLIRDLGKINNYSAQELSQAKENLSKKYRKDFFAEIVSKNGTFSTEKLEKILAKFGMQLKKEKGEDGRERYFAMKSEMTIGRSEVEC